MKALALLGFIFLGTVTTAHRLADPETLFLAEGHHETVQSVGNIIEDNCLYEVDNSIYNLIKLKDDTKDYEVGLNGLEESFNTFSVVFNMCRELKNLAQYNCSEGTRAALINKVDGVTTCH